MGIGQQALASFTGHVETAVLVIHDFRTQTEDAAGAGGSGGGGGGPLSAAKSKIASVTQTVSNAASQALSGGSQAAYDRSTDHMLAVQFNPAQLTLNASAPPAPEQIKQSATGNRVVMYNMAPAKLYMTVTLFFDDMNVYDSFMWEKITGLANINALASTAMAVAGSVHSVKDQVEALVAILRDKDTRCITFRWADFSFTGVLQAVQAQYTMFSTSGRPVRATVLLQLLHELDQKLLNNWEADFQNAFGPAGTSSNLVHTEQNFGSLLNLGL